MAKNKSVETKSVFTDQDMTVANYRSFSPFSLFAFILSAIVSLIALVNNGLMFLTGFGVLFAVISIAKLIRKQGRSTGYVMSGLALAMPLFCIAAPFTYQYLRLKHLGDVAVEHSETWLKLVQEGRIHEPFELTQRRYLREDAGVDLTVALGDVQSPGKYLEYYLKNQPEISIREDGEQATFVRQVQLNYEDDVQIKSIEHFFIYYEYIRPNKEVRRFKMDMQRQRYSDNQVYWTVARITNLTPKERRFEYDPDPNNSGG